MSLELLRRLATQTLPVKVARNTDIGQLEVLILAGQARGSIPPRVRTLTGHERAPATATAITRLGAQSLQMFGRV